MGWCSWLNALIYSLSVKFYCNLCSPCGERQSDDVVDIPLIIISIHAPRAGSDSPTASTRRSAIYFNPRSPCGERRSFSWGSFQLKSFQSTLPVRGATGIASGDFRGEDGFQSTLPVRGATKPARSFRRIFPDFNPRSPCGERPSLPAGDRKASNFNPRSPCGERPSLPAGDRKASNFNPRSPCGERLNVHNTKTYLQVFQSTLPVWGATPVRVSLTWESKSFQSTLPVWGATSTALTLSSTRMISIHAPRTGSDKDS